MRDRYFEEPYQFVPPYHGTIWCQLAKPFIRQYVRRQFHVDEIDFRGVEHLRDSMNAKHGILLAPNHTRLLDPVVLSLLGFQVDTFFYYAASWHLFKKDRLQSWLYKRLGAFSIFREGTDREAIRQGARMIANTDRPVVVFPEGTYCWQNDRLGPLQDGVALIARVAQRMADRPVVVHPVSIKYWLLGDPQPDIEMRLDRLETRLQWEPQRNLDVYARILKLTNALLAVKEIEHFGEAQLGEISYRATNLSDFLLSNMESRRFGRCRDGHVLKRVRALRQLLVGELVYGNGDRRRLEHAWDDLAKLWLCQQLFGHDFGYLHARPNRERLAEAVLRIEEDLVGDVSRSTVPMGAVIEVGTPMHVAESYTCRRARQGQGDPLTRALGERIQAMLDSSADDGPPANWNCPADEWPLLDLVEHDASEQVGPHSQPRSHITTVTTAASDQT